MSNFLRHLPCPKCRSKDNLGEWEDGSKYCFGCGYYEPPRNRLGNFKGIYKDVVETPRNSVSLPADASDILPKAPLEWLRSYGITFNEIFKYGYKYSKEKELLIFSHLPYWWQGRYFGTEKRGKYFSCGNSIDNYRIFGAEGSTQEWKGTYKKPMTEIVLTEDILSAIKVGRHMAAIPILGSNIPLIMIKRLSRIVERIYIWLDADKRKESFLASSRGTQLVDCRHIYTELDPKCYSDNEIKEILNA